MTELKEYLDLLAVERPVGSEANNNIINFLETEAMLSDYNMISLPFPCKYWNKGKSFLLVEGKTCEIFPGPFTKNYYGEGEIVIVHTLEELQNTELREKIVILQGEITKEPLQPKDYPFYYPDKHKQIIELLEEKNPKAVIAVTGKHPMCGLEPFPLIEDGNFSIPSAYISEFLASEIKRSNQIIHLEIKSGIEDKTSRQLIAVKIGLNQVNNSKDNDKENRCGKYIFKNYGENNDISNYKNINKNNENGIILVCAHMDSKYGTPGALDNAAGVTVLVEVMKNLRNYQGTYTILLIPFNGEEYYEAKGELEYLAYSKEEMDSIKLVINIDSPCHKESKTAISGYNLTESLKGVLNTQMMKHKDIQWGREWYAGDHSMFVRKGIPCIAVTSSNLFDKALDIIHTKQDTCDKVDLNLIKDTSFFITDVINSIS